MEVILTILVLFSGIFMMVFGYVLAFQRDWAWKLHKYSQRSGGISEESLEQTKEWAFWSVFRGIFFLVMGAGVFIIACIELFQA